MFFPLHSFISFSFIIFKCCYNSVSAPRDFESVLKKALGNITPSSDLHNFVFHCMTKNILSASKIPSTDKNERSFNISKRKKAEIKNKRKQSEPNFILSVWFSF